MKNINLNKKKNYKKMLEDIDKLVNNDWAFDMVDLKHDLSKREEAYYEFTQEEAQEMSKVLGRIYSISHGITCTCGDKYRT